MIRQIGLAAFGCFIAASLLVSLHGCGEDTHDHEPHPESPFEEIASAVAVIHPTEGNTASGVVKFMAIEGGVHVTAQVTGLMPNSMHGFHIHQYGDCSAADGTSAGGHYDPEMTGRHGLPNSEEPIHAGDLGNLNADENGEASYDAMIMGISIGGSASPILGRVVIVHALPDDGGQPTGNAGARIGCGVIGVANPGN